MTWKIRQIAKFISQNSAKPSQFDDLFLHFYLTWTIRQIGTFTSKMAQNHVILTNYFYTSIWHWKIRQIATFSSKIMQKHVNLTCFFHISQIRIFVCFDIGFSRLSCQFDELFSNYNLTWKIRQITTFISEIAQNQVNLTRNL